MAEICHLIRIQADIVSTFQALTSNNAIAQWFTTTKCSSWTAGSSVVWFDDTVMTISEIVEYELLRLNVISGGGWDGTEIGFLLEQLDDDRTLVRFDHTKWNEVSDHMRDCSVSWAYFLESLKQFLETGVGTPEDPSSSHGSCVISNSNLNYGEIFTLQLAAFVDEARLYKTPEVPALIESFDEFGERLSVSNSWVARDCGRLIGAVSLRSKQGIPEVERLMVAPDRRGEGVGSLLMKKVEMASRESGQSMLKLVVGDLAQSNQQIYEHLGWVRSSTSVLEGSSSVVLHTMTKLLDRPV